MRLSYKTAAMVVIASFVCTNLVHASSPRPHVSAASSTSSPTAPPVPPISSANTDPIASIRTLSTVTTASITTTVDMTVEDLQAALMEAQTQVPPDDIAVTCYMALIPIVQANNSKASVDQTVTPSPPTGPFHVFQRTRNTKASALAKLRNPPDDPLSKINVACAPLVLDPQATLNQLGAIINQSKGK